ncbi:transporter, MotA/TolQ/ExbB proton channel family protein [delta proteobacterium NaphS2]|nr:transporter, MotA/TolQ/ExbB proton channel family protein [delta proteobacterium NaphS2]
MLLVGLAVEAWAGTPFEEVATDIKNEYRNARKEQTLTLEEIKARRLALRQKLAASEEALAAASGTLHADRERLLKLSQERDEITKEVSRRLADNKELSVLFINHARNFLALAERSPYSAEKPDRLSQLRSFVDPKRVFRLADLKALLTFSFEDMAASREKVMYEGTMVDRSGNETKGDIIRLGHLPAMYRAEEKVGYLSLIPGSGRLLMSACPSYWVRRNLSDYFEGETGEVYTDISGGAAIGQLARRITMMDQLKSGGVLVIPILLVGLVASVLIVERLIFLAKVRENTDTLMTRVTELVGSGDIEGAVKATYPHRDRPTGRVLMAGLRHREDSREVIESSLSEAMLREAPRLERFLGALKACAAVAPLLGLLGTVTGMINTFQVITTHGTGDPRLMAGGISEAMVTTQVGLAVAIPVMIFAAFLGRRARNLSQDMEEKGLALMGTLLRLRTDGGKRAA